LSGEVLEFPFANNENIIESRDGRIVIDVETQIYCDKLYELFKNKELIKAIKRVSDYKNINNMEDSKHSFEYNTYFKITDFNSYSKLQCVAEYTITFETV
jgi:hypothetical protein